MFVERGNSRFLSTSQELVQKYAQIYPTVCYEERALVGVATDSSEGDFPLRLKNRNYLPLAVPPMLDSMCLYVYSGVYLRSTITL